MSDIWFERPDVDALNEIHRNTACSQMGIEVTEVGDDFLRARMPVDARTVQPYGLLHGGAIVLLAETLASAAAIACVDTAVQLCVGIEINANHVRAARDGFVTGCARPVHLGRTSQVWEVHIEDNRGRLVSIARMTASVISR